MSDTIGPNIAKALVAFQAEHPAVHKEKKHQQGYTYATLENWVDTIGPLLSKHGLALVTDVFAAQDVGTYDTKSSTWTRVRASVRALLIHESGEILELHAIGEGADPADKAVYKAITGARKYLLGQISGGATTDDPEDEKRDQDRVRRPAAEPPAKREPEPKPEAKITAAQVQNLRKLFGARYKEIAPDMTSDDAEAAYRKILKDVAGVEKTGDVPARLFGKIGSAITTWVPDISSPEWDDPSAYT